MINEAFLNQWAPRVLSLLRIVAGLLFLQHGLSKYFAWPASSPANFQMMSLIGLAGALEIVGGLLVAVGLFTRIAAFIISGEMAFAYFIGHFPRNFFPQANGGEAAILFCFVFLYIAVAGPGCWSLDSARKS